MESLGQLKVSQLRLALSKRGGDSKGPKLILVQRLKEILEGNGEDPSTFNMDGMDADEEQPGINPVVQHGESTRYDYVPRGSHGPGSAVSIRTASSRHSAGSGGSVSSMKAIEAANSAALKARASMMKERQKMEEEELAMSQKREELNLRTEIAETEAREHVFAEHEIQVRHSNQSLEEQSIVMDSQVQRNTSTAMGEEGMAEVEPATGNYPAQQTTIEERDKQNRTAAEARVAKKGVQCATSGNHGKDIAVLVQLQSEQTEAILTQGKRALLPKVDMICFKGDVTQYRSFIRTFDSRIASKTESDEERLCFLEQYTSGKPRDVIRGCMHMSPDAGYREARRLLEKRYGDADAITTAFVDLLMEWPQVKQGDVEGLDQFSLTLTSCKNVMSEIPSGARETDHPKTMRKVVEKLPVSLQDRWRRIADNIRERGRKVTFDDIVEFVDKEVRIQSNPAFGKQLSDGGPKDSRVRADHKVSATVVGIDTSQPPPLPTCMYCTRHHFLHQCEELRNKTPQEKAGFIREQGLCFACLRRGHVAKGCTDKMTCDICKRKHPTVCHNHWQQEWKSGITGPRGSADSANQRENSSINCETQVKSARVELSGKCSGTNRKSPSTMMSILPVKVWSEDGRVMETYAFVDGGSSATFCSESLLEQLGAPSEITQISMTTASAKNLKRDSRVVKGLNISDMNGNKTIHLPPTYTLEEIPVEEEDMATKDDLIKLEHLEGIDLPRIKAEIGLLIGNNCPEALQPLDVRKSKDGGPYAVRTQLGWTVQGPRQYRQNEGSVKVNRLRLDGAGIHRDFVALYNHEFEDNTSTEDVGLSREDQLWFKRVDAGVKMNDGHYEIPLPLKNEDTRLPDNRNQAERRAECLKRRMIRDAKYKEDYNVFIEQLIEKDYAKKVRTERLYAYQGRTWYIPHHGIYHPMKRDKIRVVYDCSAKYRGMSLNDQLLQGPNLTNSLVGVLLRFRQEPYAVMADIEKMFYQVRVPAQDRSLLRFLWWPEGNLSEPLEEYEMTVHVFGATSSPSCANYALRKTAKEHSGLFETEVANSINRSFYVDDFVKSASTEDDALHIARDVQDCCAMGGFHLTGFISNSKKILMSFSEAERAKDVRSIDFTREEPLVQRALGVQWNVDADTLGFRVEVEPGPPTRRGILSTISSVYDPLGLGAPFILPAKVILQDLCRLNIGWDDDIPAVHRKRWTEWIDGLNQLSQFSINRCFKPTDVKIQNCQLHHFCDASETGYGTASYIRLVDARGTIHSSLLMGKARVAPLKTCTIPRLELCAAMLAVRMNTLVSCELEVAIDSVVFWTDSISTLRYINNRTTRFQTFVANRLSTIHDGSNPDQWRYVPSALNPADDVSRGLAAQDFLDCRGGPVVLTF